MDCIEQSESTNFISASKPLFEWKLNRRNNIKRICRYVYYRNDIHCGLSGCGKCDETAKKPIKTLSFSLVLVPTGEIYIHHLDALTKWVSSIAGIVVLDSIMKTLRSTHMKVYSCLYKLIEENPSFYLLSNSFISHNNGALEDGEIDGLEVSENLLNWYKSHGKNVQVLLLSGDVNSKYSIHKLASDYSKEMPTSTENMWLQDKLDHLTMDENSNYFTPHLSQSDIRAGVDDGTIAVGTLRMSRGGYTIGFVQTPRGEFMIRGLKNLNRCINGDKVAIAEIKGEHPSSLDDEDDDQIIGIDGGGEDGEIVADNITIGSKMMGKVVGIVSRIPREFVGSLQPLQISSSVTNRVFIPIDPRIPFINIKTKMSEELEGKRITVKISDWPVDSRRPKGYWIKILGEIGHVDVETQALLIENSITVEEFSDSAYKELPLPSWTASPESNRIDWEDTTISVDPPGCTDIDDALSYKRIGDKLRIGVHIADVSHFVREGSALDMEAFKRCNTVYLVDRRHEMLPSLLTSNICSLRSKVSRYAFSVIWTMDLQGNILDTKFTKSIINSKASLTYEQAHEIIQGNLTALSDIRESLSGLLEVSTKLRARRIERGAMELASVEVSFDLDESSQIHGLRPYKSYPTNKMVEEFMLLANTSVAEKLTKTFPSVIIRRHPLPQSDRLDELNNILKSRGFDQLECSTSKQLNESFQRISQKHPHLEKSLRILGTRCMSQAVYSNSKDVPKPEWHHYGLCVNVYTHFTSPIRRYADILVHRLLEAALEISPLPERWNKKLTESCDRMNERHFASKSSSRASMELFSYYLFKKSGPKVTKGIITAIRSNGATVMCPEFGIQVFASINSDAKGLDYKIFDQIDIKLESYEKFLRLSVAATAV